MLEKLCEVRYRHCSGKSVRRSFEALFRKRSYRFVIHIVLRVRKRFVRDIVLGNMLEVRHVRGSFGALFCMDNVLGNMYEVRSRHSFGANVRGSFDVLFLRSCKRLVRGIVLGHM